MIKWGIYFDHWLDRTTFDLFLKKLNLDSQRLNSIISFRFQRDQQLRSFGYYLIKKCLCYFNHLDEHLNADLDDNLNWEISPLGKPFFPGTSFNVSHDQKYVVLVGENGNSLLGVDVCWINPDLDINAFYDYLNSSELEWINSLNNSKLGFYVIWALKEATTKGIGED